MLSLAVLAIGWAITRACVQSITLDEAGTYRAFVAPVDPVHWMPHSNNHVLNSLLMRLATAIFGLSQLTVRLPALAGACIYTVSCYCICRWIGGSGMIRAIVFACLIFNPYLSDFYVTARGYSLATGFLTCAIAVVLRLQIRARGSPRAEAERTWIAASVFLGLSFVANFSFGFIDAGTWAALLLWTIATEPRKRKLELGRLIAASAAPGITVVFAAASWTLLHWPTGQLFYGARSLVDTFLTVIYPSVYEPNPEIANPLLLTVANLVRPVLVPILCGAATCYFTFLMVKRRNLLPDVRARRIFEFSLVVTGALAGAMLAHWMAFRFFGLLLPKDRTGIYIVPLWTLAVGALAAVPARHTGAASAGRGVLIGLLGILAVYYGLCLRSRFFYEWWSCADAKDAYYVLAYYNHNYSIRDVASRPPLTDCLEFYRLASRRETFTEFKEAASMHQGSAYAGYESLDRELILRQGLRIVYRGRVDNDVVVAIRPELSIRR